MNQKHGILIVDDEEGMRDSLVYMLENEGFANVKTARNGEQALTELQKRRYDLVITDLEMPKINGYALMQVIQGRWPATLVVAITGYGSTESAVTCLRRGAFDYISKPFEMEVILAVIRRALERVRLAAEAGARTEQVMVMAEITRIVNSSLEIKEVYGHFSEEVQRLLSFDLMSINVKGETPDYLRVMATTAPLGHPLAADQPLPVTGSLVGQVMTSGQRAVNNDLSRANRLLDEETLFAKGLRSVIMEPLVVKHQVIGTFCVGSAKAGQYDAEAEDIAGQIGGLVATAANNMLLFEQLQAQLARLDRAQAQLIRSARLAAVGELADGVAHEINNPLSVILGVTQLLLRQPGISQSLIEDLEKIGTGANRIAAITRTFIEFAKPVTVGKQFPIQLGDLLDSAFLLVKSQTEFADKPIKLDRQLPADLPLIMGNESQLRRAFVDLIRNAFEAMAKKSAPKTGHVLRLVVKIRHEGELTLVDMTVEDTGVGIPAKNLSRIFEPGFTTKIDRGTVRGLGMGLFSTYGIIDTHGGSINVESEEGIGTRVLISLPTVDYARENVSHRPR